MTIYYTHSFNQNDKNESHRLLEKAISIHVGDSVKAADLVSIIRTCTEMGKPTIDGFSEFSISHNRESWAVLIAEQQCGLDIQYVQDANIDAIARKYFSEEEYRQVSKAGNEEFFRIWARREALVKAVGTTIVNSHLPNVLEDSVAFEGMNWKLIDIMLPNNDSIQEGKRLYATICVDANAEINRAEADKIDCVDKFNKPDRLEEHDRVENFEGITYVEIH